MADTLDCLISGIKGFPGYLVTSEGVVTGKRVGQLRYNVLSGYRYVYLYNGGKSYGRRVHRLVADAFIPKPDGLPQVNHKDGDKTNNSINNLEWCSAKENMWHAFSNGLNPRAPHTVSMFTTDMDHVRDFESMTLAANVTGINSGNIYNVCTGKCKTAGGYVWRLTDQEEKGESND